MNYKRNHYNYREFGYLIRYYRNLRIIREKRRIKLAEDKHIMVLLLSSNFIEKSKKYLRKVIMTIRLERVNI